MIAVSKPSVEHWDALIRDQKKEEWVEHKKMVIDRLGNMNVTAGLVLTLWKAAQGTWLTSLNRF